MSPPKLITEGSVVELDEFDALLRAGRVDEARPLLERLLERERSSEQAEGLRAICQRTEAGRSLAESVFGPSGVPVGPFTPTEVFETRRTRLTERGTTRYGPFNRAVIARVRVDRDAIEVQRRKRGDTRRYPWATITQGYLETFEDVAGHINDYVRYRKRVIVLETATEQLRLDVSRFAPEFPDPGALESAVRSHIDLTGNWVVMGLALATLVVLRVTGGC